MVESIGSDGDIMVSHFRDILNIVSHFLRFRVKNEHLFVDFQQTPVQYV